MKQLSRKLQNFPPVKPERVIQFGEGNFLRGFVDWMIHKSNQNGVFGGSVVVVQPIEHGLVDIVNEQDGLYTLILRGQEAGEKKVVEEVITSVSRGFKCYEQWEEVLELAANPSIDILVSNTTEAGIAYEPSDKLTDAPPSSYPAKVCAYLYRRYQAFRGDPARGMLIVPCELIDRNGDNLRKIVIQKANEWALEPGFLDWIAEHNIFVNTLVDRIVTGYPGDDEAKDHWQRLGYLDKLLDTGELFHLWVIEGPRTAAERFPLHQAGLNVLWVDDLTPYRTRKVRILNGAHTSTVALAHLVGLETVREAVNDPLVGTFMQKVIHNEIIPTVEMSEDELADFAAKVLERFANPFIHHRWLDISLNSISKYKTRVLPSLLAHLEKGNLPPLLALSLAALLRFYQGKLVDNKLIGEVNGKEYIIRDNQEYLEFFDAIWEEETDLSTTVHKVLANSSLWGEELTQYPALVKRVTQDLREIDRLGISQVVTNRIEEGN